MPQKKKNATVDYKAFHLRHWALFSFFLAASLLVVHKNAIDFHASVIPNVQAPPFDGLVMPVQTVPAWTSLKSDEWKLPFEQIPAAKLIPIPVYDPVTLKTPTESLGWNSQSDLNIRIAKITYSVVYQGNYKLDGIEGGGSHPAADIKTPSNTPVYAIGNGVVIKTSEQSSGFGHHIVVRHDNFPSFSNPSIKTTYFSSYSHLGDVLVAEGTVVKKGQKIGLSGETGTATTPHVHFQIDTTDAPWHPYWPFTYQETEAAGLSFFEAINAGFNQDKGLKTTINPLMYVQKYAQGGTIPSTSAELPPAVTDSELPPVTEVPAEDESVDETETQPTEDVEEPEETTETPSEPALPAVRFEMETDGYSRKGSSETITIKAVDALGNVVSSYKPSYAAYIQVDLGGADYPKEIMADSFIDGKTTVTLTNTAQAALWLRVSDNTIMGDTKFALAEELFSDVSSSSSSYKAISFLEQNRVITGYPDGTFQPERVVSRVEALKFILEGNNKDLIQGNSLPFSDTAVGEWYGDYVITAYRDGIIKGYDNGSFRPSNTVNRVEFLKMLLGSIGAQVPSQVSGDVYADVAKDAWYAPYVAYAKEKNLISVSSDGYFRPNEGMTREEVAETIYRTIILKISGESSFSVSASISAVRVREFFN